MLLLLERDPHGQRLRDLLRQPDTVLTRGSTHENAANLAPSFLRQIVARYEGTRLGRQELEAEMLDDNPDALWRRAPSRGTRSAEYFGPAVKDEGVWLASGSVCTDVLVDQRRDVTLRGGTSVP